MSTARRYAFLSQRFGVPLFFLATWLAIAVLLTLLLMHERKELERKAETDALAISSLLNDKLQVILRRTYGDLSRLNATLSEMGILNPQDSLRQELVNGELDRISTHFPEIAGLRVVDAAGQELHARGRDGRLETIAGPGYINGINAWRDGMLTLLTQKQAVTDKPVLLPFALPVRDKSGAPIGAVVALLDFDLQARQLSEIDIGRSGVIALHQSSEDRIFLRHPGGVKAERISSEDPLHLRIRAGESQGMLRARLALDGVERAYGFQRIESYPLYVLTGLAADDHLAGWRQTVMLMLLMGLLLFLVQSIMLLRLLRAKHEEERTAARLMESEARYRMLAENSHDVIWTLDIKTRCFTYVSPSVTGMCGYLPEDLVGKTMDACLSPDSAAQLAREIDLRLRRIAAGDKSASVVVSELEQVCKDGSVLSTEMVCSYLLDAQGVASTILGITRNVSERKAAEAVLRETNRQLHARIEEIGRLQVALQELAVRDSLTGLYNRRYLDETLEREVSRVRREGIPLSLVMIDIDHFKRVNDTYGHHVGDEALRMLANTLLMDVRAEDVACRYGGEEFLILLPNMPLDTAIVRAEAWRSAVETFSVSLGDFPVAFTISLGVAAYPEHGKTPDDLTRCADQALYRAKHGGRNRVSIYSA